MSRGCTATRASMTCARPAPWRRGSCGDQTQWSSELRASCELVCSVSFICIQMHSVLNCPRDVGATTLVVTKNW